MGSLLLPLYFALSGLNTNLGLLNDGKTWGYVIAVILCAFFGKIVGGSVAARWCHCLWRESFTIGVLMSCKGLVELIVLVSEAVQVASVILTCPEHRTPSRHPLTPNIHHVRGHGTG